MLRAHWVTFGVTVVPPEAIGAPSQAHGIRFTSSGCRAGVWRTPHNVSGFVSKKPASQTFVREPLPPSHAARLAGSPASPVLNLRAEQTETASGSALHDGGPRLQVWSSTTASAALLRLVWELASRRARARSSRRHARTRRV